jgi:hypothetical protein
MNKIALSSALIFSGFTFFFTACSESGMGSSSGSNVDLSKPIPELWTETPYKYTIKNDTLTLSANIKMCKIGGADSTYIQSDSYLYSSKKLTPLISYYNILINGTAIENSIWHDISSDLNKKDTTFKYFTSGKQYHISYNTCPYEEDDVQELKDFPEDFVHDGYTLDSNSIQLSCNKLRFIEKNSSGVSVEIIKTTTATMNGKFLTSVTETSIIGGNKCTRTITPSISPTINCAAAWTQYLADNNNNSSNVKSSWYTKYYDFAKIFKDYEACIDNAVK